MSAQSSDDWLTERRREEEDFFDRCPEAKAALDAIADAWVADHPRRPCDHYSTGENVLISLMEGAYFRACSRWDESHPAPPPQTRAGVPKSGFHLYRLWTSEGRLLYVGVSTHLSARLRSHRRRFGDLIDHATWEEHPDARTMLAAELVAIREEDPALNRAGIG